MAEQPGEIAYTRGTTTKNHSNDTGYQSSFIATSAETAIARRSCVGARSAQDRPRVGACSGGTTCARASGRVHAEGCARSCGTGVQGGRLEEIRRSVTSAPVRPGCARGVLNEQRQLCEKLRPPKTSPRRPPAQQAQVAAQKMTEEVRSVDRSKGLDPTARWHQPVRPHWTRGGVVAGAGLRELRHADRARPAVAYLYGCGAQLPQGAVREAAARPPASAARPRLGRAGAQRSDSRAGLLAAARPACRREPGRAAAAGRTSGSRARPDGDGAVAMRVRRRDHPDRLVHRGVERWRAPRSAPRRAAEHASSCCRTMRTTSQRRRFAAAALRRADRAVEVVEHRQQLMHQLAAGIAASRRALRSRPGIGASRVAAGRAARPGARSHGAAGTRVSPRSNAASAAAPAQPSPTVRVWPPAWSSGGAGPPRGRRFAMGTPAVGPCRWRCEVRLRPLGHSVKLGDAFQVKCQPARSVRVRFPGSSAVQRKPW